MQSVEQQRLLVDTLTERPTAFQVGGVHLSIYPPSLGLWLRSSLILQSLGLDPNLIDLAPSVEAVRLSQEYRADVLRLVALHTLRGYKELNDEGKIEKRVELLDRELETAELAQLLCIVLERDPYHELAQAYGIIEEQKERERLLRVKDHSHSVQLGGRTIYGSLIDYTAQRYGWSLQYILWGISYTNLRLLSADASTCIHLSEEEANKLKGKGTHLDGDSMTDEQWARFIGED